MSQKRFKAALPYIKQFYNGLPNKVHRWGDLQNHLFQNEDTWSLGPSVGAEKFVKLMVDFTILTEMRFDFPAPYRAENRYLWGNVPLYDVIQTVKADCYFSYHTAMKFHNLMDQKPRTTYLTVEQFNGSVSHGEMIQSSIDRAFQGNPRISKNVAESKEFRVCVVQGKNTGRLGVEKQQGFDGSGPLRVTNLERTLIDITVRPIYAGGVVEVAKAFEAAKDRVTPKELAEMLKHLKYTYPYHQAVGFYMERAGYKSEELDTFRQLPMKFDFYLTHKMGETDYCKHWKLHIPKGL